MCDHAPIATPVSLDAINKQGPEAAPRRAAWGRVDGEGRGGGGVHRRRRSAAGVGPTRGMMSVGGGERSDPSGPVRADCEGFSTRAALCPGGDLRTESDRGWTPDVVSGASVRFKSPLPSLPSALVPLYSGHARCRRRLTPLSAATADRRHPERERRGSRSRRKQCGERLPWRRGRRSCC